MKFADWFLVSLSVLLAVGPTFGDEGWERNVQKLGVIPIHAMVVPGGKVFMYGTDDQGEQGGGLYYDIWDPVSGEHELLKHKTKTNIFCTTLTMDPSTGNVLVMGGDNGDNDGVKDVLEFDSTTHELRKHPLGEMHYARWYGTSVNLPNGDVFVIGGRDENGDASVIPEVWSPDSGWRELPGAELLDLERKNWWYPHTFVNSNGKIIVILHRNTNVYQIDRTDGRGRVQKIGEKPFSSNKLGASIMFDVDKVMILDDDGGLWVVDIGSSEPSWDRVAKIKTLRINAGLSLLPDGRVAITGGTASAVDKDGGSIGVDEDAAVKYVQIWDPRTNDVHKGPRQQLARLYHSSGLILPDGRVFSGGGGAPGPLVNTNYELFDPEYLDISAKRPEILKAPSNIDAGDVFNILVDDADAVMKVTATKSGGMTHSRNADARWLNLDFIVLTSKKIQVTAREINVMLPGLWMLNTIDADGVPSVAHLMGVSMAPLPHSSKDTSLVETLEPTAEPTKAPTETRTVADYPANGKDVDVDIDEDMDDDIVLLEFVNSSTGAVTTCSVMMAVALVSPLLM
mmetsp:Transcript_16347/g.35589  ORF Transcript_16347/g.35589 Transcript_16347/m.35589 type:complete len:568 (-) Transcript_16347:74-1777(-)